jgi:uncharacterized membrane protein YqaE (UPF0057 family)
MNLSDIAYSDVATLSPTILLAVVLNGVGVFLKRSPLKDWLIPFVLIALGALIYPFIADVTELHSGTRNATAYRVVVGSAIGVISVGVHATLKQFIGRKGDSGQTDFIQRKP